MGVLDKMMKTVTTKTTFVYFTTLLAEDVDSFFSQKS